MQKKYCKMPLQNNSTSCIYATARNFHHFTKGLDIFFSPLQNHDGGCKRFSIARGCNSSAASASAAGTTVTAKGGNC